jgi:eukaryotic-like serine/threonine-protein kinase
MKLETFGKYVLLEKLAMGGMAEVYLGRSIGAGGVGKFVAIKRILPQFSEQVEFVDMFKDEASIAINLQHSNIVTITEFGMEKNQFFIVMDFVNGRNLKQILNKVKTANTGLGIEHIVYVAKEIAAGLDHAHRCLNPATAKPLNIIHRDMSPHNVMLSFDGEIKVVDFGIAKAETQIESTRAGTLKGKFGYMSPEQADAQEVDQRTDVFSLGIILWELLANDRLFIGKNEIEILRKIKECNIQPLRKLNANIPPELEKIVSKALAKDRNLRYRNAEDLHRDLHRFLNLKYPDFSKQDFAKFLKTLFAKEIEDTHRKLLDYAKLDFSQLVRPKRRHSAPMHDEESNSGSIAATQKSIRHNPSDVNKLEKQLEKRLDPRGKRDEPAQSPGPAASISTAPFEVKEMGKVNILEARDGANAVPTDGALKIEPPKRAPNPYSNYNSTFGATGTAPAGPHGNGIGGGHTHVGTYSGGTRSRLENSSFHRQSSSYASLIAVLIVIGVLVGGGVWYITNPQKANSIVSKIMRETGIIPKAGPGPLTPMETTPLASTGPVKVMIPVSSNPPGAEILINGKSTGELTPTTLERRDGEEIEWTLRLPGHKETTERLIVQQGRSISVALRADRKAFIDITVMGNGEISVDGKVVAATGPLNAFPIAADQDVTVRVFDPVTKASDEVRLRLPENTTRRITLIPRANIRGPRPAGR